MAGAPNLGRSIEMVANAVQVAELVVDKQAQAPLMPIPSRGQLHDLPDDLWIRISIEFYRDVSDGVLKSLVDWKVPGYFIG